VLWGNLSVTLPYKGQRGVTMATTFGTKIPTNVYKCISTRDNENMITYNIGFLWSANTNRHFCLQGSKDVAMATKFWPKYANISQNWP